MVSYKEMIVTAKAYMTYWKDPNKILKDYTVKDWIVLGLRTAALVTLEKQATLLQLHVYSNTQLGRVMYES